MEDFIGAPLDLAVIAFYFMGILAFGSFFARYTRTTSDFFFAGRRFAWWLIALSGVATTVGSYSFIKYSEAAFTYGLAATQSYTNDWMWMPLLVLGWIPIIYYNHIRSIPEYFDRRFGPTVRLFYTVLLLLYMLGYVGINLFTLGKAVNAMMPNVEIFHAAIAVACFTAIYVTAGGQSSVIMTDLFQAFLLLGAGILIFFSGLFHIGDFSTFWSSVPQAHRHSLGEFAGESNLSFVKIFWQDGVANTFAFYFVNQGMVLRFLAAKSAMEARKAVVFNVLFLMPIASFAVCNAGLIGRATFPETTEGGKIFVLVSELVTRPGFFGLVMAALVAALMSTADTLVNGMSAIAINDVWRPYLVPGRSDRFYLNLARIHCLGIMAIGLSLVPLFMNFATIYDAHGAFTAAVTPPLVVSLFLAILWRGFNQVGALAVLSLGTLLVACSLVYPDLIRPFAHGVPIGIGDGDPTYKAYKYMRACYGLTACFSVGVVGSLAGRWMGMAAPAPTWKGLSIGSLRDLMTAYKGSEPNLEPSGDVVCYFETTQAVSDSDGVVLPRGIAETLRARIGDLIYVQDARRWLGGLKSIHGQIQGIDAEAEKVVIAENLVAGSRLDSKRPIRVEKIL